MISSDPLEMKLLTQNWLTYLASLRLKLLLYLNAETLNFLSVLQFNACEENFEEALAFSLTPFYNEEIPEYKLIVEVAHQHYELSRLLSPPNWQINSQPLALFFKLNPNQEKFLSGVLDSFDPFAILARLRTESLLNSYKEKYIQQPIQVQDVINEENEFFLIFSDGSRAKLSEGNS